MTRRQRTQGEGTNYGVIAGGDVRASNIVIGSRNTIRDAGANTSLEDELTALKALIAELPAKDAVAAASAVGRMEQAAKEPAAPRRTKAMASALEDVKAAADSSVGVLGAAEKILGIVARLAKLVLL